MPSKKMEKRIEKENEGVGERIERLQQEVSYEGFEGAPSRAIVYLDPQEELDSLSQQFPKATNIPDTTQAFCSAIGTTEENLLQIRRDHQIAETKRNYEQLAPYIGATDMCDWYSEALDKNRIKLGLETIPDLLELAGLDATGQELIDAVAEQEKFCRVPWDYKVWLNDNFEAANFEMPDDLKFLSEM